MAQVLPVIITQPLRNKVCIFPTEDNCELSSSEINSIIRRNPYSFNNLLYKPYIKRLQGLKKYKAIKRQYVKYKKNKIIEVSENPGFYIYNIIDNENNEFVGIIGKIPHQDYIEKKIHKIEKSANQIVKEKTEMIKNTGFVAKPITVIHEENDVINDIIKKYKSKIPLYEFTRTNGFIHEVWQVLDPQDIELLQEAYNNAGVFYIADDNDRFEALHRIYLEKIDEQKSLFSGQEAFNYFPTFLISQNQIKIHEYKKGLPVDFPKDLPEILQILEKDFEIEEIFDFEPPQKNEILLYSLGRRFKLLKRAHLPDDLPDSVIFEKYVLSNISEDYKLIEDESLKYCDGKRSSKCVDNQLQKGNCKFGFIIKPMSFDEIKETINKGIKIPYKSLYLEPRPLTGLFIYEI